MDGFGKNTQCMPYAAVFINHFPEVYLMNALKKYIAEFIGTFVLVFFACGTAAVVGCSAENGTGYLLTALAFGLVIGAMAYSIGNVSAVISIPRFPSPCWSAANCLPRILQAT